MNQLLMIWSQSLDNLRPQVLPSCGGLCGSAWPRHSKSFLVYTLSTSSLELPFTQSRCNKPFFVHIWPSHFPKQTP